MNLQTLVKAPKNIKQASFIRRKYYHGIAWLVKTYNNLIYLPDRLCFKRLEFADLDEIRRRSLRGTDISDHLETLFLESLRTRPKLIVELGVGPGESNFVFEKVARIIGATFISVDINPSAGNASSWPKWQFINSDDLEFAQKFSGWCKSRNIDPLIDILFVDTSHQYGHTVKEINHWFPFLSNRSKVFFHDTNAGPLSFRKNGSIGIGYDIDRGVIHALEDYFQTKFNEKRDFRDFKNGWLITHYANCSGLTILEKIL